MDKSMKLSELPLENIKIIKDGTFNIMALCDFPTDNKTFTFINEEKYLYYLKKNPNITCVMCTDELVKKIPESIMGICASQTPKNDFFFLHNRLCSMKEYKVNEYETRIGSNSSISPLAHIEAKNVTIGNNVIIEEFVSIKSNTQIGDNVTIRAGAIIGCDGFEFKSLNDQIIYIEHTGGVIIGNNVDIYSNSCICKAIFPWDNTIIGDYTKIDNLVHVGHACKIGKRNYLVAGVVLCGSVFTEDDVYIGPNATIAKIKMSKKSKASLGSVVIGNVETDVTVSGNFAIEHLKMLKHIVKISM